MGLRQSAFELVPLLLLALLVSATALTLVEAGPLPALALALSPWLVLGFLRSRVVLSAIIVVVAATAALGRDFSYLKAGPIYALDLALILFLLLAIKEIATSLPRAPFFVLLIYAMVSLALAQLFLSGVSGTTLRQSVIGLYAVWGIVGLTIAGVELTDRLGRWLFGGTVVGLGVFGAFIVAPANGFSAVFTPKLISAAGSLYAAYALFAVLFAPHLSPRRFAALGWIVAVVALIEIAAGEVRSIWVALAIATPATFVLSGFGRAGLRAIARLVLVGVLVVVAATAVAPRSLAPLQSEAISIFGEGGNRASVANAQWRLTVSRQAIESIKDHPFTGIGFGEAETFQGDRATGLHNSVLGFGLRFGIPGLILLALFEIVVLVSARRFIRIAESTEARALMLWLVGCQIVTAVHSMFTVVLEGPYMGIFFWLFGGLITGLASGRQLLVKAATEPPAVPAPSAIVHPTTSR